MPKVQDKIDNGAAVVVDWSELFHLNELLMIVLSFLDQKELKCAEQVSHQWFDCCETTIWNVACLNIWAQLRVDRSVETNRKKWMKCREHALATFVGHPYDLFHSVNSNGRGQYVNGGGALTNTVQMKKKKKKGKKSLVLLNRKTCQMAKSLSVPNDPKMVILALDQANKKWNFIARSSPASETLWKQIQNQKLTSSQVMNEILRYKTVSLHNLQLKESKKLGHRVPVLVNQLSAFGNVVAFSLNNSGAVGLIDIYTTRFVLNTPDKVFHPHLHVESSVSKDKCMCHITHMKFAKPENAHVSIKYHDQERDETITILYNVYRLIIAGYYTKSTSNHTQQTQPFLQEWSVYQCVNEKYAHVQSPDIPKHRFKFVHDYYSGLNVGNESIVYRVGFDEGSNVMACFFASPSRVLLFADRKLSAVYQLATSPIIDSKVFTVLLHSPRQLDPDSTSKVDIRVDLLTGFSAIVYEITLTQITPSDESPIVVNRYWYSPPQNGSMAPRGNHATVDSFRHETFAPLSRFVMSKTGLFSVSCWNDVVDRHHFSVVALDHKVFEVHRIHSSMSAPIMYCGGTQSIGINTWDRDEWIVGVAMEENTIQIITNHQCYYGCFFGGNTSPHLSLVAHTIPKSKSSNLIAFEDIPSIIHHNICVSAYLEVVKGVDTSTLCFTF